MALVNQSIAPNQSKVPTGGLASNGAIPKKQTYTPFVPDPRLVKPQQTSGMINQPRTIDVATPPVVNVGGKSQVMKGNPSVLEQQKALNKDFKAGLVEDGYAGPLTKAAIAKYGGGATKNTQPEQTRSTQNNVPSYDEQGGFSSGGVYYSANSPEATNSRNISGTGTQPGMLNQPQPSPYVQPDAPVGTTTGTQIQNVANAGRQTPQEAETYAGLLGKSNTPSQAYQDAINEANRVQQNSVNYARDYSDLTNRTAGTAGFLTQQSGLQGLLNNQYNTIQGSLANQYSGAASRLAGANTQQGLQLSAAQAAQSAAANTAGRGLTANQSVLSAVQPQFGVGYGTQVGQPGLPGGGIDTSLSGVSTPANIASIQDFTSKINSIDSQSGAVDTNFSRAVNYASSAGITDTSSILAGLQSRVQSGALGDAAIAGFNQVIGQINQQASALGFDPIDPQNVTPAQLRQIQEAVKKKLAVDRSNLQSAKDKLLSGGTSGSSSGSQGGNMFGSFFGD